MVVKLESKSQYHTLGEVKKTVSDDCFRSHPGLAVWYLAVGIAFYSLSIGVSYYVWIKDLYFLFPLAWFLGGTAATSLFVLGHDCAHESFTGSRKMNSFLGHILFMPSLYPYYAWKFSHNAHHHLTNKMGAPANSVYYDNAWIPLTVRQYNVLAKRYPFRGFLYRLSRNVLLIGSNIHNFTYHFFPSKFTLDHRKKVYFSYIVFAVLAIGIILGSYFLVKSPLAFLHFWILPAILFQFWMSLYTFLHHTAEHVKIYDAEEWSPYKGQILSTINCTVPRFLSFLHFNIDIHTPHHLNVRIPSYKLRKAYQDLKKSTYSEDITELKFSWKYYISVIRACKLWDAEAGRYVGYDQK